MRSTIESTKVFNLSVFHLPVRCKKVATYKPSRPIALANIGHLDSFRSSSQTCSSILMWIPSLILHLIMLVKPCAPSRMTAQLLESPRLTCCCQTSSPYFSPRHSSNSVVGFEMKSQVTQAHRELRHLLVARKMRACKEHPKPYSESPAYPNHSSKACSLPYAQSSPEHS